MHSVNSSAQIFNFTIIDRCNKKQFDTSQIKSNAQQKGMYIGVLYQNQIRKFCGSICYLIGPPYILYEDSHATINILLEDIMTPQSGPLYVLVTSLHQNHVAQKIEVVDTRSNIQLSGLNYKPHLFQSLRDIIYCAISTCL